MPDTSYEAMVIADGRWSFLHRPIWHYNIILMIKIRFILRVLQRPLILKPSCGIIQTVIGLKLYNRGPHSASYPLRTDRSLSRPEIIASDRGMSLLFMLIPQVLFYSDHHLFEIEYINELLLKVSTVKVFFVLAFFTAIHHNVGFACSTV